MADFIYNQNAIPKDQWRYGLQPSARTGCGWIATYNALHLLHKDVNIEDLIAFYEHQLPLIHGNFGTSFWGPALCFRRWGYSVRMVFDRKQFDAAAKASAASILFFRWKQGAKFGAHFAALRYNGSQFIGFNTFRRSHGPDALGESLPVFLRKHRYFGAILITISPKP